MKIFSNIILCVFLIATISACNRSVAPSKKNTLSIGDYDEDLSAVRIKYEIKPNSTQAEKNIKEKPTANISEFPQQVNNQVNIALDSIANRNKNIRYSSGYRIQFFVGNDRKEVDEAKAFIYQNFPELNTYLTFSQPSYKLKAGDFTSRLDAERYYSSIRQRYSAAMIISEKIDVKKSMQIK